MMRRALIAFTAAALAAAAWTTLPAQNGELGPAEVIQQTAQETLDILENRREELAGNPQELHATVDEVLLPIFDVQYAGDLVLGRHAREASADQRRRFARGLYQALMRQYSEHALDFSPERLDVQPVRGEPDPRRTRVDSTVRLQDGSSLGISYMMRETDEGWKIFDVIAEGISYVVSFREQYDGEIRRLGLDEVIARLERAAQGEQTDLPVPDLGD